MLYEDLGKRVKQQRKLAHLTQEKLAEKAGISFAFIGHIERGTRKASVETLVKISNALKISPSVLLRDSLDDDLLGADVQVEDKDRRLMREIFDRIREYKEGEE